MQTPARRPKKSGNRYAAAIFAILCIAGAQLTAEPPGGRNRAPSIRTDLHTLLRQHGAREFKKSVRVSLYKASAESIRDRSAPRRAMQSVRAFATERAAEAREVRKTAWAATDESLEGRLVRGCADWLVLIYEMTQADAALALHCDSAFLEEGVDHKWKPPFSPAGFSLSGRHEDIAAIDFMLGRMEGMKPGSPNAYLLPEHRRFLANAIAGFTATKQENIQAALVEGCSNPYDLVYWNFTFYDYEKHKKGEALFARVCQRSLLRAENTPEALHAVLRFVSYPGGGGGVQDPGRMMRYDPRLLAIADRTEDDDALAAFTKSGRDLQTTLAEGRHKITQGEDEVPTGRVKGLLKYFELGRASCGLTCSLVYTPLMAQGHDGVTPLFLSRPYTSGGHWIGGLLYRGDLYCIDGGKPHWGPSRKLAPHCRITWLNARNDAPFTSFRIYRPTLATWAYSAMFIGHPDAGGFRYVRNDLLNRVLPHTTVPEGVLKRTVEGLNTFDVDEVTPVFAVLQGRLFARAGVQMSEAQVDAMTEALRVPLVQLNAWSDAHAGELRHAVRQSRQAADKKVRAGAKETKKRLSAELAERLSARRRAALSALTPEQRSQWHRWVMDFKIWRVYEGANLAEATMDAMKAAAERTVQELVRRDPLIPAQDIWPVVHDRIVNEVLTDDQVRIIRSRRRGEEQSDDDWDL